MATSKQGFSSCLLRSCDQMVTGRRLRYGRALAIIQAEEYLDAVSYHRGIQILGYSSLLHVYVYQWPNIELITIDPFLG